MDQAIIDLYDEYTHAPLERRVFLARLTQLAGGAAAAAVILARLEPNYARAAEVDPADPRLAVETIEYSGASGPVRAYQARPADAASLPAVIVIHENRGLNPHIEDVTRRAALNGFLALAPDLLSPLGGTPADPDQARELIGQLDTGLAVADVLAAIDHLKAQPVSNGRVGAMGFCWGGGTVGHLAVAAGDRLDAAVVFYGRAPDSADVERITAPLLLHYAGLDERINAGVPDFQHALDAAGVDYTLHMYDGVNHAFHNDTSAERYDAEAASVAWDRTMAFLKERLTA
ncbi:MAG TPA: dienelactone hydrolase family protein [Alphaproteobacteria bacterium]|nr:dienelactone hydrolase family protein [Alphaproteobacteria bacterium]